MYEYILPLKTYVQFIENSCAAIIKNIKINVKQEFACFNLNIADSVLNNQHFDFVPLLIKSYNKINQNY